MIIRKRKKPKPLQKLDALIPRISPAHPKLPLLRKQAASYQKGYNGERKLDYHLQGMPEQFTIINDATLDVFGKKFQMDSLIITSHAIFIIEVKSVDGTVTFDTKLKQFIQENGERYEGYKYPITQAERIQYHLISWLQKYGLSGLPIYYFVAFSEQSTIINVNGNEEAVSKVVTFVDEIPLRLMKIDNYLTKSKSEDKYLKNKIISVVMRECEDFDYDSLRKFGIDKSEVLPGVHCPECGTLGMIRLKRRWNCNNCNAISQNAHEKALYDYSLLFHNEIRNEECRKFLLLNTRFEALNILKNSGCKVIEGTRLWLIK